MTRTYVIDLNPLGKTIQAFGERISPNDFAETFQRVTGKKFRAEDVTADQFETNKYKQLVGEEVWLKFV